MKMKKIVSVILTLVMLIGASPLAVFNFATKASAVNYKYIQFGNYPQSKVTDSGIISALNLKAGNTRKWTSYGYYSGTGNSSENNSDGKMTPKNYMKYKDVFYGGTKYRGVYFTSYRPYGTGYTYLFNEQESNGYYINTVYWFKYEPITWRVLDPYEGLILSENIIDSQAYNNYILINGNNYYGDPSKTHYASNYYYSSLREWLNETFYNTAFTDGQKENIEITHLNNNCFSSEYPRFNAPESNDKIFLLSYNDAINTTYGFSSSSQNYNAARRAQGTDYAMSQGLDVDRSKGSPYYGSSSWWLRSPRGNSYLACNVRDDGNCANYGYVFITSEGIRPACKLSCLESDISQSDIFQNDDSADKESIEVKYKSVSKSTLLFPGCENLNGIIEYSSSNPSVVTVDKDGKIYAVGRGVSTITCTVTDEAGNTAKGTCNVNVKFSFGQWFIWIFLLGFLWY